MSARISDLAGRRFGRLKIPPRSEPEIRDRHAYWPCICDCGGRTIARGSKLLAGVTISCGCYRADSAVRQGASMTISPRKRIARAKLGGAAYAAKYAGKPKPLGR